MRRCAMLLALVFVASVPGKASASVPSPHVAGPITGGLWGHPLWDSWYTLAELGYTQAEYFVSGTARSAVGQSAPYTTRIIVTRPIKASRFNGTVLLDWVNVTAQFENAVDSLEAHEFLQREGFAFVHVSAQAAGICCTPLTPKVWDPVRYATLSHPGDDYSYDMFSQVARVFRRPKGLDPMRGLHVERILAAGQSQSASFLYDYVTGFQAKAGIIDGFLIHGGGSKTLARPPTVPVFHLFSDAEASPGDPNTRKNYRLWEIAGASHSDFWLGYHQEVGQGPRALLHAPQQPASADEDLHVVAGNYGEQIHPLEAACILAGALFPMRYAVDAALHHLDVWVRTGKVPPRAPRFRFDAAGTLARDEHQNAMGGLRLPPVDVPIATYESTACELGGFTVPFTPAQIAQLYPTHTEYYSLVRKATARAVRKGYLLPEDAKDLLARARAAKSRWT